MTIGQLIDALIIFFKLYITEISWDGFDRLLELSGDINEIEIELM